ncbi:hypothetical protein A4A49_55288 [Nicotiana attenuata]|uniref:Uncharacterized protein n=1 Tax=Nicotiana attenuata TaxID=49451 RepID=A0A1J6JNS3_NICAT|nr:hypothetical protein A4A49_55288 [Nicotiana attenuata]
MSAFTFQNQLGKHSWFILWSKQLTSEFSQWFIHQWWPVYGHRAEILPTPVKEGYDYFCHRFSSEQQIPILLQFSHRFHIPWIYSQKFSFHKLEGHKGLPWLALQGHCKWYKMWDSSEAYVTAVDKWFLSHRQYLAITDAAQILFLQQKSIASAQLAGSSSRLEFIQQMEQILDTLKTQISSQQNQASLSDKSSEEEEEEEKEEEEDLDFMV